MIRIPTIILLCVSFTLSAQKKSYSTSFPISDSFFYDAYEKTYILNSNSRVVKDYGSVTIGKVENMKNPLLFQILFQDLYEDVDMIEIVKLANGEPEYELFALRKIQVVQETNEFTTFLCHYTDIIENVITDDIMLISINNKNQLTHLSYDDVKGYHYIYSCRKHLIKGKTHKSTRY